MEKLITVNYGVTAPPLENITVRCTEDARDTMVLSPMGDRWQVVCSTYGQDDPVVIWLERATMVEMVKAIKAELER